jgi:UV DNA damage endonuclease
MTSQSIKRIGFACKFSHVDAKQNVVTIPELNTGGTTITWLNKQSKNVAEQKLWDLMVQNVEATRQLVTRVGTLDPHLRMVRISSDILPAYTHPNWNYFWLRGDVVSYLERHLSVVGDIARTNDVRLSMHPGQFVCLASINPGIVQRSIEEFEYHANISRWMGYGKTFQDFKINVHIGGKAGPAGIRAALKRLTPEARNAITIENDEFTWGLDSSLELANHTPLVLDVHHHFIHTGEYIQANDDRIKRIIDSWRGVRPTMHYAMSREDLLIGHDSNILPNLDNLLGNNYKKQKLRAHSDAMWNTAVNDWAYTHWSWADVMVEAKNKNLASFALFDSFNQKKINETI